MTRHWPLTWNWQQEARNAGKTLPIPAESGPPPGTGSKKHGMRAKRCLSGETSPVTIQ